MDQNIIIKLSLIDIFPSLEEIEHNYKEEISIIFQGLNNFYNLKDLLINKKDIYLDKKNSKNTIMISLVQSINILATGILNIKSGKQWVTFSYENKRKLPSSNFALNLIDCIKINIACLIIYNNTEKYNNNINITNKIFNKNNLLKKDTKKNLAQKKNSNNINQKKIKEIIINNKYKYNNSQDHYLINSYNSNGKESLFSTEKEKRNNFKVKKDSNFIKNMNSFSTIGKENKKFDLNSSLSLSSNKYNYNFNMTIINQNKMYSTIRQKFKNYNRTNHSLYDNQSYNINEFQIEPKIEIKEEHNLIKKNKTNNQLNLNVVHKKQKSCNTLKIVENKTNLRYKNSGEKNGFKNLNDSNKKIIVNNTVERKNTKNNIISNKNYPFNIDRNHLYNISSTNTKSYFKKSELMNSFQKDYSQNINNIDNTDNENKYFKNINLNNINNAILFNNSKQINSEKEKDNDDNNINISESNLYERNQTVENMDNIYFENDNFTKLKEDFFLLYTNDYIKNVKEDLLKLEIELFVEKMTELTREYHIQLYDKLLEYQIEKNKYQKNLSNFWLLNKLYNKLHSIKANKENKKNNMNENKANLVNINKDIFKINQNEIKLYKLLLYENTNNNIEKKIKLKNLFKIIVNKKDIKNIINSNNKNIQRILNNLKMNSKIENNSLVRTRIIPKNQQTKFNTNHLSLATSYILENCNDKYEYNLNDIYSKTHIFSPVIKIKDFKHISTSKRKYNVDNK